MHSHPKISNRSFRVQLSLFFLMSTIIRVAGSKKFHGSCKRQQASLRIVGQHISLKDHTGSEQIYQLDHAIDAVKNRHVSVRRAEEQYGIPKSTIHDHVSGRVSKGAKKGNPSISQMMMRQCLSLLLKNVPALDTLGQGSRY